MVDADSLAVSVSGDKPWRNNSAIPKDFDRNKDKQDEISDKLEIESSNSLWSIRSESNHANFWQFTAILGPAFPYGRGCLDQE